jgi:hypothetical protein
MSDTNGKIQMAESAVRVLREGLKQPTGYKSDARQHAAALRAHVVSAQGAVDAIREFIPYIWQARGLVTEADRLTGDADRVLRDLDTRGAYRVPVRSQMTVEEQVAFIRQHGKDQYLALPWG